MGRGDGQHVPSHTSQSHPCARIRRWVRPPIHPDRPLLLVGTDGFPNRNELMRDGIPIFPDSHLERPAMDIFHNVDLTLMLRKRKSG
jgi:hypothetical protein